jgi:hypothetical protein
MNTINKDCAVEALWRAGIWHPVDADKVFDNISARLRRHPRFSGMTTSERDLLLADARRELAHNIEEHWLDLVKQEIEFEAPADDWIDWPADDNGMTIVETANGWIVVEREHQIAGPFLTEELAARWIDACLEQRDARAIPF